MHNEREGRCVRRQMRVDLSVQMSTAESVSIDEPTVFMNDMCELLGSVAVQRTIVAARRCLSANQ